MANTQVNPTRMELTKLKKQLATSVRGHKLLKDKQDEMVRQYMLLIKKNRALRLEVEEELNKVMKTFAVANLNAGSLGVNEALMIPSKSLELSLSERIIMNIHVPVINTYDDQRKIDLTYDFAQTPSNLDSSVLELSNLLPKLVKLAEIEKTCDMLAVEIEKTRRRVNAIEYVMIPSYEETIHFITMKLDDNERSNTIRLMKSKELIINKNV